MYPSNEEFRSAVDVGSPSIAEAIGALDAHVSAVFDRLAALGRRIRFDDLVIAMDQPTVNSLADAVAFVDRRVDMLEVLVEHLAIKLG